MLIRKKPTSGQRTNRDIITTICWTIVLLCVIHVTPANAEEGGGLGQGVNDSNTFHDSPLQTTIEIVTWAVIIRVMALYRLP